MIVTTGKSIKIDCNAWGLRLVRSCETPGLVTVTDREGKTLGLPANEEEAERFIVAYRRAIAEDIPYRESVSEKESNT